MSRRAPSWTAVAPGRLADRLGGWLTGATGTVRVAFDGPDCAAPDVLAQSTAAVLRTLGRPAVHLRADAFWHDASLRFEHGREDVESYLNWLDADALTREALLPAVETGTCLPTLRDPRTNRSTREPPMVLEPHSFVVVSGPFLLGRRLPFDRAVHLLMSPAARTRRTPPDQAWTLPAHERYDTEVRPSIVADVLVKLDDPAHPAVQGLA